MTIEELQAKRQEINRQIRELRKQGEVEAPGRGSLEKPRTRVGRRNGL